MDARERLLHYLQQRRELGESEFTLDSMSMEDAMKALGVTGASAVIEAAKSRPAAAPSAVSAAPTSRPDTAASREAAKAAASGDWREALRAVGAENPVEKVGRYEMPKAVPAVASAHADAPGGLVVGSAQRDLSDGPLAHLSTLDEVAKAIAACQACGLYKDAKHAVPGEGNPNAGFVCVGEAPGATEDETGRPFVGAAGQLLTKILEAIQLKREDVFICNVLKHRPPGNRNPSLDEITACSPFLLQQLALLQPRVILALGTFAAQTLLQTTTPMGKLRGQVHRFHGVPLIVTYHPAALLRNPNWKRPTWEDVQLARRIFDSAQSGA